MITSKVAVDHVGLSVPNLEQAIDFFVSAFGCKVVFHAGPYDDLGFTWPGDDGPENTTMRLAMLRMGDSDNIEILEYTRQDAPNDPPAPRVSQPGGMHLCFYVEDIYEAEKELRKRDDIRWLNAVSKEEGGPLDGLDWSYFLTDWGLVIELIRWPEGLPYEQSTSERLVSPPWRHSHSHA
ncbi:MAG: VOC family protein [Actinomycetales bacterium]|nr:VOC family protein [Leifsonia sp.]